MSEELRVSNAHNKEITVMVYQKETTESNLKSFLLEIKNCLRFEIQMKNNEEQRQVCQVSPGTVKVFPLDSVPFANEDPCVSILIPVEGTDDYIYCCINYRAPRRRCIIVRPNGGMVLARNGKHWTAETDGCCYNVENEVPDSWIPWWCTIL